MPCRRPTTRRRDGAPISYQRRMGSRSRPRYAPAMRGTRPLMAPHPSDRPSYAGHTLVELLVVLALLALAATAGAVDVTHAVRSSEARSSAQAWQAAAAAAQTSALWSGRPVRLSSSSAGVELVRGPGASGVARDLGALTSVPSANVIRWREPAGVGVTFAGGSAAPDSGGTLQFGDPGRGFRVTVRVESGLTVRSR